MRRQSLILLSLVLVFACGYASAAVVESPQISAETSSTSQDSNAANDRGELGDAEPSATPVRRTEKAKTVVPQRSSGTRAAAPRWHSFLPGMIR